eukprot:6594846-Prymnesium_polylepis.1
MGSGASPLPLFDARRLAYWHGKLYRPYYSRSDRARFDAAEFPGSGGMDNVFPGSLLFYS